MMIANLYIRVSTDEQANVGYSQRDQDERLRRYCEINNISIRKVIYEDHSAKTFNRPEWKRLLADLKKYKGKSDLILFTKWDRFSRNAGDAYQMISTLKKLGVEPQAVEQPLDLSIPENKMMLAFYLAAPEVENDRRALNVFHGMRRAKKEGRWMASAPVGYINKTAEDGKKFIEPVEPSATIMKWVFQEISNGQFQIDQIRKEANKKGLKCGRANFWSLIHNPVYCGKIAIPKFKDEEAQIVHGLHKPIISESLFYDVQDTINGRKKNITPVRLKSREEFPLRGFLLCPNCGKLLTGSVSKGSTKRYSYYHCISPCKARYNALTLNEGFSADLKKFIPSPSSAEALLEIIVETLKINTQETGNDRKQVMAQLEILNTRLKNAREMLADQKMDPEDFREVKTECQNKINVLEAKLTNHNPETKDLISRVKTAITTLCKLDLIYDNGTSEERRQIISSIYPEKMSFDGKAFRTTRLNSIVQLIYRLDKGSSEIKNRTRSKKLYLSGKEVPSGFEPL